MALDVNNFRQILKCLLNLETEIRTQAEVNLIEKICNNKVISVNLKKKII